MCSQAIIFGFTPEASSILNLALAILFKNIPQAKALEADLPKSQCNSIIRIMLSLHTAYLIGTNLIPPKHILLERPSFCLPKPHSLLPPRSALSLSYPLLKLEDTPCSAPQTSSWLRNPYYTSCIRPVSSSSWCTCSMGPCTVLFPNAKTR